jgi:hypothetical protein
MLVSVKEASIKLKVSERTIQNKAKKQGLPKIGNQYQITTSILDEWVNSAVNEQTNETKTNQKNVILSRKQPSHSFTLLYVFIFILFSLLAGVVYLNYISLNTQINEFKTTIKTNADKHQFERDTLIKTINKGRTKIHSQELQIQYLKMKDSIRELKKEWY